MTLNDIDLLSCPAGQSQGVRCAKALGQWMLILTMALAAVRGAQAAVVEFNNTGGTTSTNGLHFYIEDTTKIQVRRLNNTGQVYSPGVVPSSASLDNGVFIRANGKVYGPNHTVSSFTPTGGMYSTYAIGAVSPVNPASPGDQQTATGAFGLSAGPQVSIVWKYTTPLDFLTAEVTLVIPTGYAVSAANPVRYYHVFDTYLGGSDSGCGVLFTDSNNKRVIGTYPPPSGTSCPSSTSIPSGVSVVESFRERSGPAFSSYCAASWSSFFANGSVNCSVLQAASMSNTVVTTYQDTGIGIEYDFTATGTYTFSYDFVIGSTAVPPYDHLEIQHDGAATLCPENVTVLACTSSTVPCPAGNRVNTGVLSGALTTTPGTPAITKTPTSFTLGSAASTAVVVLQGTAPGGTYTLGTSGLSAVPLNGTKCWNTASNSQSCTLIMANTPCVSNFECLETSLSYNNLTTSPTSRNPLYTKLAGTDFKFDVVALQSSGAVATSYTAAGNVTVELFDDSTPPATCSAYTSPVVPAQAITFAAGDAGRKTLTANFNVSNAYRKLRCRVKDTNLTPTVYGCSSDDFAVRPSGFSSVTSSANADSTVPSPEAALPTFKTGANFTISAVTVEAGYNGKPKLGAPVAHAGSVQAGVITGTFANAAPPTPPATGSLATGLSFTYSEVGYFMFNTKEVYDDTFTGVDPPNQLGQPGDCTNDFSNTAPTNGPDKGKYGCKFGNTVATNYFGRFIPHHFAITTGTPEAACKVHPPAAAGYTPTDFTYFGQDGFATPFKLTAQNLDGAVTQNYTGNFARLDISDSAKFSFSAPSMPTGSVLSSYMQDPTNTTHAWANGVANVTAIHRVSRPNALTGPTTVTVKAQPADPDGVTLPAAVDVSNTGSLLRYGRLRLMNAIGPDTRDLKMGVQAQYWNGSNFVGNLDDSCTVLPASAWSFGNYVKRPASVVFNPVAGDKTLVGGSTFLMIPKPGGGRVTFDTSINLAATGAETAVASCLKNLALSTPSRPWAPIVSTPAPSPVRPSLTHLAGAWCDPGYVNNPFARGSFGLYHGAEYLIFQRENY